MIARAVDLLGFASMPEDGVAGVISPRKRFIMIPVLFAAFSILVSCASQDMSDVHELKQYEGAYQFVPSKYRGCAKWEYVQLEYDEHTKLLTVKPIGTQRLRPGMNLMAYGPLDGQSKLYNVMFTLSEYRKYVAKKTDDGWQLKDLRKECQMRFFCSTWQPQALISFTKDTFHVGLPQDTEQCTYLRLNRSRANTEHINVERSDWPH
jgi:hypothetical protein